MAMHLLWTCVPRCKEGTGWNLFKPNSPARHFKFSVKAGQESAAHSYSQERAFSAEIVSRAQSAAPVLLLWRHQWARSAYDSRELPRLAVLLPKRGSEAPWPQIPEQQWRVKAANSSWWNSQSALAIRLRIIHRGIILKKMELFWKKYEQLNISHRITESLRLDAPLEIVPSKPLLKAW